MVTSVLLATSVSGSFSTAASEDCLLNKPLLAPELRAGLLVGVRAPTRRSLCSLCCVMGLGQAECSLNQTTYSLAGMISGFLQYFTLFHSKSVYLWRGASGAQLGNVLC